MWRLAVDGEIKVHRVPSNKGSTSTLGKLLNKAMIIISSILHKKAIEEVNFEAYNTEFKYIRVGSTQSRIENRIRSNGTLRTQDYG